jgi:cytochrome P450
MGRVRSEVRGATGSANDIPENLRRLTDLHLVLRESLRLYPPIHGLARRAVEDVVVDGFRIAAGTRLLLSTYLVQRHPSHWVDPAAFRPERWHAAAAPHPYTYLPFGGGPRNCLGAAFAQIEAPLIISTILRRFDLHLVSGHPVARMGATLTPGPRVFMRVRERT